MKASQFVKPGIMILSTEIVILTLAFVALLETGVEGQHANFETATTNKHSFKHLNGQLILLQSQILQNFKYLNNKIDALSANVTRLNDQVETNTNDIAAVNGRVDTLQTSLDEAISRIQKLESINKIWQNNFRVVNKTFAELRKKVKFVVPVFKIVPASYFYVVKRG